MNYIIKLHLEFNQTLAIKKIVLFLLLMFSLNTYSQENAPNYIIDFITTENGLSHNFTTSVISDNLNVKWIGTENGNDAW